MRGTKGNEGHDRLWTWFGLSRASFCVMPRVLMHEMPDQWQAKMADLLEEFEAAFQTDRLPNCKVQAVDGDGKFRSWPDWVLSYRHPDRARVDDLRRPPCELCGKLVHECQCVAEVSEAKSCASI